MATGSAGGAPRAKESGRSTSGRYVLVSEVARGYLGALWLGCDSEDPTRTVLVRRMTPLVAATARAAILDAARWSQDALGEDCVEIIEGKGGVDFATPLVDAEILRALLRTAALRHAAPGPSLVLGIVKGLLSELVQLHEDAARAKSPYGVGGVHPDSILVGVDGTVRLLDVGIGAAASGKEPWRSDPQRMGYFAPEHLESRVTLDAATDVFAVGIVLWEALSNRRLFPGNDAKTVRERLQKTAIPRLDATRPSAVAGIPTEIADVVARALERDPSARFRTTAEMLSAIEKLECADARQIGEWAVTFADTAIAKRRQMLERVSGSMPPTGQSASNPPAEAPAPSLRPGGPARPGSLAPQAPAKPSLSAPPPRPSTRTPPPPAVEAVAQAQQPAAKPSLSAPPPTRTPPPPAVEAAAQAQPSPPKAAHSIPPRPSTRTPAPAPVEPAALQREAPAEPAHSLPLPPSIRTPELAPTEPTSPPAALEPAPSARTVEGAASTDPEPNQAGLEPAFEVPPPDAGAAMSGLPEAAAEGSAPVEPEPAEAEAEPRPEPEAEAVNPPPLPETAKSRAPSPPSKRPSSLPRPPGASVDSAGHVQDHLLQAGPAQLAQPIHTSALSALTAPAQSRRSPARTIGIALGGCAVVALSIGFLLGRGRSAQTPGHAAVHADERRDTDEKKAHDPGLEPSPAAVAKTREVERGSAETTPPPSPAESAPSEATASAAPPVAAADPPPVVTASTPAPPQVQEEHDAPSTSGDAPAKATGAPSGLQANALHRPPPSHSVPNSGYKPGGI